MARNTQNGPTPVDSITHDEKRTNIPTADNVDFHDGTVLDEVRRVRYARDESLDPQLVWRGKYRPADEVDFYDHDLIADAPPVYIQEKIDPRVLIENLRRTADRAEDEPELALFDSFDGLDDLQQIEYYEHDANWSNRLILGDSLQVMASLAEREKLRGKVQMVYIDPPYGVKFGSNWQVSTRSRTVKDGKPEDTPREVEQIKAYRDTWELGISSYLTYLRDRLLVSRELLTETGSCFVQISDENVHLIRSLMDEVFGSDNFQAQIAFTKTTGLESTSRVASQFDYLIWYAKDAASVRYRALFERKDPVEAGFNYIELPDGTRRSLTREEKTDPSSRPKGLMFKASDLTKPGPGAKYDIEMGGKSYSSGRRWWGTPKASLEKLIALNRVIPLGKTLGYVRYFEDFPLRRIGNLWQGFGGAVNPIYVVQTNSDIVQRCMLMCTEPGDLVLDPTCGSGTTAYVAEHWGRRWITIDTSRVALALARQRLMGSLFPWYLLADSTEGQRQEDKLAGQKLEHPPASNDIRQGFVYERVLHITQSSIANNPDVHVGSSRTEVDAAIRRHAEFEHLVDKPYEDKSRVRVAGPFTVESLSPHRALSFRDWQEPASEAIAGRDAASPTFEQSILDNLAKAGIQNGTRSERIKFSAFESYAGSYIQAIGEQAEGNASATQTKVGIAIGPQYGTVSAGYVKHAAREAIQAGDIDLLCMLGFAFDPNVTNVTETDGVAIEASDEGFAHIQGARQLGKLPVLMVRMNADLLMGEELKKTGAGNLFTVFGEPDIEINKTDSGYVVDLRGVDIYDPTTGEIRSNDTSQIALWMIDTDYNGESFFVRHCYFTGGGDPYKRLRAALQSDISEEAWESLYQTTSRPFPTPSEGNKIAIKVIDDYGDEVMKVFEL